MIKKILSALLLWAITLFAVNAKVYTVENLPVTKVGEKKFVCNPDGILSSGTVDALCRQFQILEDSVHVQVLVVAVDSMSPADDYRFAEDVANHYGVGMKGFNSGLVILLSRGYRAVRFVTGEGLEGDLPDAICKRIIETKMIPYLRNNDWDGGMQAGCSAVYDLLMKIDTFSSYKDPVDIDTEWLDYLFMIFFFGVLPISVFIFVSRMANRCPSCKKQMRTLHTDRYSQGFQETIIRHMQCPYCGRTTTKKSIVDHTPVKVSGGGGSFGGGRSGGGRSFGGGSFGGGGAGGRF